MKPDGMDLVLRGRPLTPHVCVLKCPSCNRPCDIRWESGENPHHDAEGHLWRAG